MTRRTAVKLALAGTIGLAAGAGATAGLAQWIRTPPAPYQFFSENEAGLLIPLCEQIIPADDTPGATEAGVIYYIDRQLVGPLSRYQQAYRTGLEAFRKTCIQIYMIPFEKLPFDRQTEAVSLMESGKVPQEIWGNLRPQEFFNHLLDHTRQGFYGSPRHGGNRDYASYRMIGLAYPNLIGQNRYAAGRPI